MVQNNKSDGSRLTVNRVFGEAAALVAKASGQPAAFATAAAVVIVWAASGPIFHYSDTWQLVINTGTTIVTFLVVFLNSKFSKSQFGCHPGQARRIDPRESRQKCVHRYRATHRG